MSQNNSKSSAGLSLPTLIFLVFLVMKLAGIGAVANWSWWWVTAPLWGGLVVATVAIFFYIVIKIITSR